MKPNRDALFNTMNFGERVPAFSCASQEKKNVTDNIPKQEAIRRLAISSPAPVIKTNFICPPIPIRGFDWQAYVDGREETGPYGYGITEQAAIVNLLEGLIEQQLIDNDKETDEEFWARQQLERLTKAN